MQRLSIFLSCSSLKLPILAVERTETTMLKPDPPPQTNPIRWSLSLCAGAAVSAFGAGYFDDAADVPGQPVLHFGLRGTFRDGEVELVKVCVVSPLFSHSRCDPSSPPPGRSEGL
jgi:hypothetical protein